MNRSKINKKQTDRQTLCVRLLALVTPLDCCRQCGCCIESAASLDVAWPQKDLNRQVCLSVCPAQMRHIRDSAG